MESSLQEVLIWITDLILLLFLIGFGIFYSRQTPLQDITKAYLEVACTKGGFTSTDINNLKNDLSKNGYDSSALVVNISPVQAQNITSTNYAKRGTVISLEVIEQKDNLLSQMYRKIGGSSNPIQNRCIRYGMSEKF